MRYKFAADSFYVIKLCSRPLVLYCRNCVKDDKCRYFVVFWTISTIKDEKSAAKFHYIKNVRGRVVAQSIASVLSADAGLLVSHLLRS